MSTGRTYFPLSGNKLIFFNWLYQEMFAFGKLIPVLRSGELEPQANHPSHYCSVQSVPTQSQQTSGRRKESTYLPEIWNTDVFKTQVDTETLDSFLMGFLKEQIGFPTFGEKTLKSDS